MSKQVYERATRDEVLQTIQDQIAKLKRNTPGHEPHDQDDGTAAGVVACLTCGKAKQRAASPFRPKSPQADTMTTGYDKLHLSLSDESYTREDYEHMLAVMKGEAGLKNLSRQYLPLKPKPNTYLRRSHNELEPLYRRYL